MAEMNLIGQKTKIMILIVVLLIVGAFFCWKYLFSGEDTLGTIYSVSGEQVIINKALGTKVNKLDVSFFESDKFKDLSPDRFTTKDLKSLKIGNSQPFEFFY